jgi:hypothetical protein
VLAANLEPRIRAGTRGWGGLATIQTPLLLIGGGSTSQIPQDKLEEVIARLPAGAGR